MSGSERKAGLTERKDSFVQNKWCKLTVDVMWVGWGILAME